MNDTQQNRLNMIEACLALAQSDEHRPTWENQDPLDFTADVATLASLTAAAKATAQKIQEPINGSTILKGDAETALENCAIQLAAAIRNHCKKTGDMENYAKVNYTPSGIRSLRHQDLVTVTKTIRDCGTMAATHPDAAKRGITPAKVAMLTTAIGDFEALLGTPRARITDRTAHVRELVTQLAACMAHLESMDDLVLQFAGTPAGDLFVTAWQQARIIVDAGVGPGEEPANPPTGGNSPTP